MGNDAANRATPLDVMVGKRVRHQRTRLGMSQGALAQYLGVTFQQVQKYEKGTNRIGASRLHGIADALGVPVGYFFEYAATTEVPPDNAEIDPTTREALLLTRAFLKIDDPGLRRSLIDLVQSIADATAEDARSARVTRKQRTEPI